jgi:hypothetical protein
MGGAGKDVKEEKNIDKTYGGATEREGGLGIIAALVLGQSGRLCAYS